jgi:exodeoxyribonuclease V alpha subunit
MWQDRDPREDRGHGLEAWRLGRDHAVQIVAPLNAAAGVDGLNQRFHELYRQAHGYDIVTLDSPEIQEVKGFLGNPFCLGEPVIYRRNDYGRGLFNGSLGHVVSIDVPKRALKACFDGVEHEFVGDELIELALAYRLTYHRFQGSQAERVIVSLFDHPLVDVSWIYTAVTRAEKQVVLVGDPTALASALARPSAWTRRRVGFDFHAVPTRPSC